jgi:hypothetical protein
VDPVTSAILSLSSIEKPPPRNGGIPNAISQQTRGSNSNPCNFFPSG